MVSLKTTLSLLLVAIQLVAGSFIPARDYEKKNYFLVELDTSQSNKPLREFIHEHLGNYTFEHQLVGMDDHFIFSIDKSHPHNEFLGNHNSNDENKMKKRADYATEYEALVGNSKLKSIHLLPPKKLNKRMPVQITKEEAQFKRLEAVDSSQLAAKAVSDKLDIQDPTFFEQWHLVNTFNPGQDVNVSGLWYEGITGKGIVTAIVDDGLDYENPDLAENFNAKGSWDFNGNKNLPLPALFDDYHGTRCAGEIAAVRNDVCGLGVAYDSQVSGIRILSGAITAAEEASAMMYGLDTNDIYSCSWGPTDDGKTLSEPDVVVKKAMIKGIQSGRSDKGSVYVFASGNGGRYGDSCNFDGYTNSIYSITVGAIDFKGLHPTYAEACSAVMVVTYSSGSGEHIHTTDIHKKCSSIHGGTSAAAPLAAGIYSLVLGANPNLTWRDVQHVSVLSSVPINQDDGEYQRTSIDRLYSHKYGYGKIDAYEMVHLAKRWKNVKAQAWMYSDVKEEKVQIQSGKFSDTNGQKISRNITLSQEDFEVSNVEKIEHVTVKVNIQATFRGHVGVRLISPAGVTSELATFRPKDASGRGFRNWTFMSVAHWGENGRGDWTLEVFGDDSSILKNEITLEDWQLRVFGESIKEDGEKYDLDKDYAKVRRDRLSAKNGVATTTKAAEKTTETTTAETKTTEAGTSTTETQTPTGTGEKETETKPSGTSEEEEEGTHKNYNYDHIGQYFIGVAIIGFIAVLLLMKFHKTPGSGRRRRRRDDYEFDIIPVEDYSDSDNDDQDSLDLGRPTDHSAATDVTSDDEPVPGFEEGEEHMFSIGGDEDEDSKTKEVKEVKSDAVERKEGEEIETDGLLPKQGL